jgi:hypothetical protein
LMMQEEQSPVKKGLGKTAELDCVF